VGREREEGGEEIVVGAKPSWMVAHAPSHRVGDVRTYQTPSWNAARGIDLIKRNFFFFSKKKKVEKA
jgi:hypothetical protein